MAKEQKAKPAYRHRSGWHVATGGAVPSSDLRPLRHDPALVARARALKAEGKSYREIAIITGVCTSTLVCWILNKRRRAKGYVRAGKPYRPPPKFPDAVVREARRLRRQGLTLDAIAAAVGAKRSTVWQWVSYDMRRNVLD